MDYDAIAEAYAAGVDARPYNALYERPAMLDLLGDVAELDVLDAGCGPGWYAERLTERGARVTAIDSSARMTGIARARLGARATVLTADMARLGGVVSDASQDIVLSSLAIHYLPALGPLFAEWARVLRPGGRLVCSTHHPVAEIVRIGGVYTATEPVSETWSWLGEMRFFRRPLSAITEPLAAAGFVIERLVEPPPSAALRAADPAAFATLSAMPGFLLLRARLG